MGTMPRSVCVRAAPIVALLIFGGAGSASGASDWGPAAELAPTSTPASSVRLGMTATGYAVAVWQAGSPGPGPTKGQAHSSVMAAVRAPGTDSFAIPTELSGANHGESPQLAVAADGTTAAVWRSAQDGVLRASFRTPTQDWGAPVRVARKSRGAPRLSANAAGDGLLVWRARASTIRAARLHDLGFEAPRDLMADRHLGIFGPAPATSPTGRHAVIWSGKCSLGATTGRHHAARVLEVDRQGRPGPIHKIPRSECPDAGVDIAIAGDRELVALINGSLRAEGGVRVAVRPPGESFDRARLLSEAGQQADFGQVEMSAAGTAIAAWDDDATGVMTSVKPPEGSFSSPVLVSGSGGAGPFQLAVQSDGTSAIIWESLASNAVQVSYRPPDSSFGAIETVSDPLPDVWLISPTVAIGAAGEALAAWPEPTSVGPRGLFVSARQPEP